MRRFVRALPLVAVATAAIVLAGCGSRTGLLLTDDTTSSSSPPPPDVCPDASATLVYVIDEANGLRSFDPSTTSFTTIGTIACPTNSGNTPFSMAVDRAGIAYVEFYDGGLFRVSTADASCQATSFVSGSNGFPRQFGMGYSRDPVGTGETLFVAGTPIEGRTGEPSILATIDSTLQLSPIATIEPAVYLPELTGSPTGQLYAFYAAGDGSAIGQVDETTAALTPIANLPTVVQGAAWAFALWGGNFYLFTSPPEASNGTTVQRYSPADGSVTAVTSVDFQVVGAGVSTCAPAM